MSSYKYSSTAPCAGPGDHRPTAQHIVEAEQLIGKLTDRVILITGASSGIGLETARVLYRTGAHLFLTVRDMAKGEKVKAEIEADWGEGKGKGKIDLLQLDMESLDRVRQCAAAFLSKSRQLHVLICNAGVMATPAGSTTKDGFEMQFGVNHLAHFLLFHLLKDVLLASSTPQFNSRVVVVSSWGHSFSPVLFGDYSLSTRGYDPFIAYGQSKTANIYMAHEIDRRYAAHGLRANSLHPGAVLTGIQQHVPAEVLSKATASPAFRKREMNVQQGAATVVWAAVGSELEGMGGKYCEDCRVAVPKAEANNEAGNQGYAPWVEDAEAAKRLWEESLQLVGVADSEKYM